jgi:hypothetical protein
VATVERAARTEPVGWLGRAGLAAQGIPYVLVALVATLVAVPGHQPKESNSGALRTVVDNGLGRILIVVLALGFAADALWRLGSAVGDRGRRSGRGGMARRIGQALVGIGYLGAAAATLHLLQSHGGGGRPQTAFDLPLGRELVYAAGAGFGIAAAWALWEAVARPWMQDLDCGEDARPLCETTGVVGHAGRGLVWATFAWFLLKAAWEYDPQEAVGLDGALRRLQHQPYGAWLVGAVAVGMCAYALFCFVQARYRHV